MDRKRLADRNIGLITQVIKRHFRYRSPNIEFDDLLNSGYIGLRKAAERFDPNRGTKFSTFAYHYIRNSIQKFMYKTNTIIMRQSAINHIRRKKDDKELLKLKNIFSKNHISLDLGFEPNSSPNKPVKWIDCIIDEKSEKEIERIDNESEYDHLMDNIEKLGTDEKAVIYLRFGIVDKNIRTLDDVGKILKLTRERTRQIEESALKKLKKIYGKEIKDGLYFKQ